MEARQRRRRRGRGGVGVLARFVQHSGSARLRGPAGRCATAPAEGEQAPDFELPDQEGGITRLGPFRGRRNVVLCFYPKNRILGCPSGKAARMAGSLAGPYPDIRATGSALFAVSADTVGDQEVRRGALRPVPAPGRSVQGGVQAVRGAQRGGAGKAGHLCLDLDGRIRNAFRGMDAGSDGRHILRALPQLWGGGARLAGLDALCGSCAPCRSSGAGRRARICARRFVLHGAQAQAPTPHLKRINN